MRKYTSLTVALDRHQSEFLIFNNYIRPVFCNDLQITPLDSFISLVFCINYPRNFHNKINLKKLQKFVNTNVFQVIYTQATKDPEKSYAKVPFRLLITNFFKDELIGLPCPRWPGGASPPAPCSSSPSHSSPSPKTGLRDSSTRLVIKAF
jgi:hypothetical protein